MQQTDCVALAVIEVMLLGLLFISLAMDAWIRVKDRSSSAQATVVRGETSMNSLYVMYGIATVVYSLLIQVAPNLDGYRVSLIALNYISLTYLFFFSSWFRNRLFFPLLGRARKD
jgi:hypothetical protein